MFAGDRRQPPRWLRASREPIGRKQRFIRSRNRCAPAIADRVAVRPVGYRNPVRAVAQACIAVESFDAAATDLHSGVFSGRYRSSAAMPVLVDAARHFTAVANPEPYAGGYRRGAALGAMRRGVSPP